MQGKRPREGRSPTREREGRDGSGRGEKASKECPLAEAGKGGSSRMV